MLSSLVGLALYLCAANALNVIGPVGNLHIVNKDIAPDSFTRATVLAGATAAQASFPGPLIKAFQGDNVRMNVVDELTNHTMLKSTSIHWHGIYQTHTNWADGPAFVTQCPITTGHSFEYDFNLDKPGTYWYHSHLHVQYCDGLRGPLVVYARPDPRANLYDVDDETTVITLADWYHEAASTIFVGNPETTLINGKGRWSANPTSDLAVITVKKGKRYRFRLINIACDPNYIFSIEGHSFSAIEADSVDTVPTPANAVQIFAAQRYSIVLNANQAVDNYWIRAQPDHGGDTTFTNGVNSAILRYVGAPNAEPTSHPAGPGAQLNEADLHPLTQPHAPGGNALGQADVVVPLALDFSFTTLQFTVNGVSFVNPSVPVLLQILSGAQQATDLLPSGSVYTLPRGKVIELVLQGMPNAVGGPHPFHLHGQDFWVVQDRGAAPNFANPVRRDTTPVVAGQNTTIRFVTNNPGPWFLHCHIDFHLEAGFAVVMAADTPGTKAANPVPQSWKNLCPLYDGLSPDDQ